MRNAGVELFRFPSARDAEGGTNVGAFTPAVFHHAQPQQFQHWHCSATRSFVEFARGDLRRTRETHRFDRSQFLVNDRLPSPAL
jgi:hypothetical protein